MTAVLVCGRLGCKTELKVPARGPRPTYCSDACRKRAGRGAVEQGADVPEATPVRSFALRRSSAPGLGDGDWCPQDAEHGRMYFVDQAKTRQWCPHSAHRGDSIYQRDGVTPASRPADQADPAASNAERRALDPDRLSEAPVHGRPSRPAAAATESTQPMAFPPGAAPMPGTPSIGTRPSSAGARPVGSRSADQLPLALPSG